MKTTVHKPKRLYWFAGVTLLVLAGLAGITQVNREKKVNDEKVMTGKMAESNEDSVEIVGTPTADDPWKELEKIVDAYYSNSGITYKGLIKVIDDNKEQEEVLEEQPFEYTMVGNSYYSRLGEMEFVNRKNCLLVVDHAGKVISYAAQPGIIKSKDLFNVKEFKELLVKQHAHAQVTQLEEEKILTIDNISDPSIQGYRIYYSPENYRVHKMLIGMARPYAITDDSESEEAGDMDSPLPGDGEDMLTEYYYYLEVVFASVRRLALKEKQFNPESKFIRFVNGKPELQPAYSEYHFVNAIEP